MHLASSLQIIANNGGAKREGEAVVNEGHFCPNVEISVIFS
jgi:hypothetical protein